MRIRPTDRLAKLAGGWLLVGIVASLWPVAAGAWWAVGAALLAAVCWEGWRLRRVPEISVERSVPGVLSLGVACEVRLRISAAAPSVGPLRVQDHPPESFEVDGLPQEVLLQEEGWSEILYRVRPLERGEQTFGASDLLAASPFKLLELRRRAGETTAVRVLPNFQAVANYALLAMENRLGQLGIRLLQRRGEGLEFQELRDYREGDSRRQIDWAATARRQKLISRQYQEEKDQRVVFLVDCGRRMHARDGEIRHFDHVLNAVLLLTYVALRQGDSVGLMTFGGQDRWLSTQRGPAAMNTVLRSVYDLTTSTSAPDYLEASRKLLGRERRRCLVVLITNLRDEDAPEIVPALQLLRRRNLVLLASLREAVLEETAQRPLDTFNDALLVAATHHYTAARQRAWEQVGAQGCITLDTVPQELPLRIVHRYLDLKRSGRL